MSKRIQVEECTVLDIKRLPPIERSYTEEELIRAKFYPDEPTASTGPRVADLMVTWANGQSSQRVSVKVVLTFPNYGRTRQWFECPVCHRRVAKLFSPDPAQSEFRCRHCYRLVYRSQYEW